MGCFDDLLKRLLHWLSDNFNLLFATILYTFPPVSCFEPFSWKFFLLAFVELVSSSCLLLYFMLPFHAVLEVGPCPHAPFFFHHSSCWKCTRAKTDDSYGLWSQCGFWCLNSALSLAWICKTSPEVSEGILCLVARLNSD